MTKVRDIVSSMTDNGSPDTVNWKLKTLYESCMALDVIDSEGKYPLMKLIQGLGEYSSIIHWTTDKYFYLFFQNFIPVWTLINFFQTIFMDYIFVFNLIIYGRIRPIRKTKSIVYNHIDEGLKPRINSRQNSSINSG